LIVALALLGVLAWLKIDGASVAAIAAAGTVVAWLSTPPKRDGTSGISIAPPPPDRESELP
jgi:small-conductance mechanosensitive channel